MTAESRFSLTRAFWFSKNIVMTHRGHFVLITSAALCALFIFALGGVLFHTDAPVHSIVFMLYLFLGGAIITSHSFRDLHAPETTMNWLTVPASKLEKLLVMLWFTSLGYALFLIVLFTLASPVVEGVLRLFFGRNNPLFRPFQVDHFQSIAGYMLVQSLFFLGSAYFKSHPFIKTFLALCLVHLALFLFALLVLRVVFFDFFDGFVPTSQGLEQLRLAVAEAWPGLRTYAGVIRVAGHFGMWFLLPLTCWWIAYLRMGEVEV
jgi:hypothetical protein